MSTPTMPEHPDVDLTAAIEAACERAALDLMRQGYPPRNISAAVRAAAEVLRPAYEPAALDAATTKRCRSCEHPLSMHQPDGCWYSVTIAAVDSNAVCPCAARVTLGHDRRAVQ